MLQNSAGRFVVWLELARHGRITRIEFPELNCMRMQAVETAGAGESEVLGALINSHVYCVQRGMNALSGYYSKKKHK